MAYIVSGVMSVVYIILPLPGLIWGIDQIFKYIGFYAVGVFLAAGSIKTVIVVDKKLRAGAVAVTLLGSNFVLADFNLTTGIMWFITALIGVVAVVLISQIINKNRILQYLGRITLIVLCIHGPIYRIIVKIVSMLLHMSTDRVRENFLLAMVVVGITMLVCSIAYEVVIRIAPWMVGKKKYIERK